MQKYPKIKFVCVYETQTLVRLSEHTLMLGEKLGKIQLALWVVLVITMCAKAPAQSFGMGIQRCPGQERREHINSQWVGEAIRGIRFPLLLHPLGHPSSPCSLLM